MEQNHKVNFPDVDYSKAVKPYYRSIGTSMCDFEPFYRRMAKELPDGCRIVEIGVADGYSALMLAREMYLLNKKFHLTMIDNCDYGQKNQAIDIMNHIARSGLGSCIEFVWADSLEASCKYPDNYFHFVFIDASHKYEQTKADIRLWYRKVMDGHILAGHDYLSPENPGVKDAVDEVVPVPIIRLENTDKGLGVFWMVKSPEVNLN